MLRNKLKQLDMELQRHRIVAKGEISAAKEAVRQVEQETLQGMRSLATGKTDIELAWKQLDTIQTKHKVCIQFLRLIPCWEVAVVCTLFSTFFVYEIQVIEEDLLLRINEIREKLDKAEDIEEADLLEKERVIMERRAARMKVR